MKPFTNHPIPARSTGSGKIVLTAIALAVLPFSWNAAHAQTGEWIMAPGDRVNGPEPRTINEMVYDSGRDLIVMYGGWPVTVLTNGTWEWNGEDRSWTQHAVDGPPSAYGFGMAYDPVRAKTVVSGGFPDFLRFINAETWEWGGAEWTKIAVDDIPYCFPAMAYHPVRQTVIRHGGFAEASREGFPDTMEWNGTEWLPLPDGPPLSLHRMVYDSRRDKMVVFGGIWHNSEISNETWEFDGTNWEKVAETGPAGREGFAMVFDAHRGVTVLFGGGLYATQGFPQDIAFNDMWQWDGSNWTEIPEQSIENYNAYQTMAYDSKRNEIVLFGGGISNGSYRPNDTWILRFLSGIPKTFWSMF